MSVADIAVAGGHVEESHKGRVPVGTGLAVGREDDARQVKTNAAIHPDIDPDTDVSRCCRSMNIQMIFEMQGVEFREIR